MITITEKFKKPTRTGTIALGYVDYKGERYAYRRVKWTAKQCEKANIVANRAGGDWNKDILANQFEIEDLKEWGFEEFDLNLGDDKIIEDESEEKNTIQEKQCPKCGYKWNE